MRKNYGGNRRRYSLARAVGRRRLMGGQPRTVLRRKWGGKRGKTAFAAGVMAAIFGLAAAGAAGGRDGGEFWGAMAGQVIAADVQTADPETFSQLPAKPGMSFSPYRLNCTLIHPLAGGRLTDGFGWRYHPITGKLDFHYGDDYAAAEGTEILAASDGVVTVAGSHRSYGNYLMIEHSARLTTLYAHCTELLVEAGDTVTAGEVIALVGMTGEATGPHLHFEVIGDGVRYNPEMALMEDGL